MPFQNVIDDYSNGATGTIITPNGGEIGYKVTGTANTVTVANHGTGSAQIYGSGANHVTVTFEVPVVGASITFQGSNSAEKYMVLVDGKQVDLKTLIDNGDASFGNVGSNATHKINDDGTISGGHHTDGSIGHVVFHIPVTSLGSRGHDTHGWDGVEIGIDSVGFSAICFDADTRLAAGPGLPSRRAGDLETGDMLWTQDAGSQTIRWVGKRRICAAQLAAFDNLRPVRIAAGALGRGLPHRDLRLSRQHRLLVDSRISQRVCGSSQALLPAISLTALPGIEIDRDVTEVTYVHVLFDAHHILSAEGAPCESLLLGPQARATLPPKSLDEIRLIFPQTVWTGQKPCLPAPDGATRKQIVSRHVRNRQPLLQGH